MKWTPDQLLAFVRNCAAVEAHASGLDVPFRWPGMTQIAAIAGYNHAGSIRHMFARLEAAGRVELVASGDNNHAARWRCLPEITE